MGVNDTWVSPAAGGLLDLATGGTVNETIWDAVISDLLHLGGTAGYVPAAALAVEAWTSWTPTVTQSVGITISITYARYMVVGKTAFVQCHLAFASAGGADHIIVNALPAAIALKQTGLEECVCGTFVYKDTGIGFITGAVIAVASTVIKFMRDGDSNYVGYPGGPVIASGDAIGFDLVYEIA